VPARGGGFTAIFSGAVSPKVNQKWKKLVRKCEKTKQKVLFYSKNGGFFHMFFHNSWSLPPKIRQNV
jgi:hypothetical protein